MPDPHTDLRHRILIASPAAGQGEPVLSLLLDGKGAAPVIHVRGDLDMDTSHLLTELVDHVVADREPSLVVLDLSRLRSLGAEGVSALLCVRQVLLAHRAHLVLLNPPALARHVLAVTRVIELFRVRRDASGAAVQLSC